jgi:hypothetical protein
VDASPLPEPDTEIQDEERGSQGIASDPPPPVKDLDADIVDDKPFRTDPNEDAMEDVEE